jgi:hypothetical protein
MTRAWDPPPHEPTPDQLAAYYDGALTGPARAAVDTWLADHPDDTDDELARALQATQPADPAPEAWAGVLDRVAAAVPPRRRYAGLIVGAAAAAALVAVLLGRALWPPRSNAPADDPNRVVQDEKRTPGRGSEEESEPLELAAPSDVRVICMEGDDTHIELDGRMVKTLIVGEPPVPDELLLPTSFEKTRLSRWGDPELHFDDWGVPMIVDPAVLAKGWTP